MLTVILQGHGETHTKTFIARFCFSKALMVEKVRAGKIVLRCLFFAKLFHYPDMGGNGACHCWIAMIGQPGLFTLLPYNFTYGGIVNVTDTRKQMMFYLVI